jgi:hypothetical protein
LQEAGLGLKDQNKRFAIIASGYYIKRAIEVDQGNPDFRMEKTLIFSGIGWRWNRNTQFVILHYIAQP